MHTRAHRSSACDGLSSIRRGWWFVASRRSDSSRLSARLSSLHVPRVEPSAYVNYMYDLVAAQGGNGSGGRRAAVDLDLLFQNSERMRAVGDVVRRAADTNATILLPGESGTGKEMVGRAIHSLSDRHDKPFLT